ncbi:restriction endonuclease subunit S [Salinivibrio sp. ML290]|uniref:restriction endonuclease subunit S n=1 Tax=Salinivibrio sp. ML290 TaxID=1909468 RepID=UPI00098841A7|nr:restriction endonuclease subunit S [Salinivibrio sp. ML290]OOE74275.1 hypothetical protein BZG23_09020 [Salinivibrio sp. ML290]
MVPEGWKPTKIGDISSLVTSGSRDWAKFYSDSGSKFIRMTNLRRDGIHLKMDDLKFVNIESDSADGKRTSLQTGDILISITAELGKIGWVPPGLGEAYINQHTALVRVKPTESESKFVAYLLSSKPYHRRINALNDAGAKAGLNLTTIRSLPIALPDIPEQKKIAQLLSTWDQAITATERLLENSQQRKKGLMQQLLTGKKRLPGFEGEWASAQLGDLVEITSGSSKAKYIDQIGGNYIIDMGSVTRTGRLAPTKKTSLDGPYLAKGQLVMPKDDIGGGNIIGRVGVIPEDNKYLLADHVYALTPHGTDSQFLGYLVNSDKVNKSLRRRANGTAQLGLGKKDVQKQAVLIPSDPAEQKAIGEILLSTDQEFDFLEKRLAMLQQEKKALMQQLLTGKRRVNVETEAA